MRVARSMLFSQSVQGMNRSLSDIIRLNEQTASQKRINRPSDDPGGMARALDLKTYLTQLDQYSENIDTAEGWLSLADDELGQASDVLTRLQELAEQASTGTLSDSQRAMLSKEARELMGQMIAIANTEYAGESIFAGSKTGSNAYEMGLSATVRDSSASNAGTANVLSVSGASDSTIYVEFADSGTAGVDELAYRYSSDGGFTWKTGTLAAGETTLNLGTAQATLESGSAISASSAEGEGDGTAIWVRPSAVYQGNREGDEAVYQYGGEYVTASAEGVFNSSVTIRVSADASLPGPITYAYSTDKGATWVEGNVTSNSTFSVPGGFVTLASNGGSTVAAGDQFVVEPYSAALDLTIGKSSSVQINSVGTDIFGGLYEENGSIISADAEDNGSNLFESIGKFIGFLETNDQDGIGDCLEEFSLAHETLSTAQGAIGGREVRVEFAQAALELCKESTNTNISAIEDADITQLSVDLARAEYIYQSVLSTSAQVMQLSLLNYL